jgi:hypothetical protein
MRTLLVRGLAAGLAAALVAFVFAYLLAEPQVDAAIAVEEAKALAAGEGTGGELVSRGVQSTLGLLAGLAVYGVALGGLLALAFAVAQGRLGRLEPRATALLLALAGFAVVILVPWTKYPGNPPAVGDPGTIGDRTGLFFVMLAISLLAALAALRAGRALGPRLGGWNAGVAGVGVFLAVVVGAQLALPPVDEVAADFPAMLLWRFRLASLGTQLVLWGGLGLVFGALAQRALAPARDRAPGHAAAG